MIVVTMLTGQSLNMQNKTQANGLQYMRRGFGNMSNDNGWRDSDTTDIRAIVHNTVEFTLTDPIVGGERPLLMELGRVHNKEIFISQTGRVIVIKADYVDEATTILADCGIIEDVALIKHITEYEIQHDDVSVN